MRRREMQKFMSDNGYLLVRTNKHYVYRNEAKQHIITVPNGSSIDDRLAKKIMLDVTKGRNTIYSKGKG